LSENICLLPTCIKKEEKGGGGEKKKGWENPVERFPISLLNKEKRGGEVSPLPVLLRRIPAALKKKKKKKKSKEKRRRGLL